MLIIAIEVFILFFYSQMFIEVMWEKSLLLMLNTIIQWLNEMIPKEGVINEGSLIYENISYNWLNVPMLYLIAFNG